ncbi:MAG: helix-turn-helix domain-containing protein [Candidatus Omnitrophica bacterium]|nr:helix-turn-helix domain-containing protein [Candidatus Omnitrophota bacterium]
MFNKMLTNYRERAGIKKTDLARKIDVSLTYIVSLESGRQKPPTRQICERLADALALSDLERNELIELAVINRVKSADLDTITCRLNKSHNTSATQLATEKPRRVPVLAWESANKAITEDDIPAGLETVAVETPIKDNTFALRIKDAAMAPEFLIDDVIIVDACSDPKNGDFVLAIDAQSRAPVLRQFKNYGTAKILHPLAADSEDIVLEQNGRYTITGKIVERTARVKRY